MMQEPGNPENSTAQSMTREMQSKVGEKVEKLSERANQWGGRMSRNVDRAMDATATGLEKTSSRISQMASYFREHNTHDLKSALENSIRKNPMRSLVFGVLFGMVLNGILRRR